MEDTTEHCGGRGSLPIGPEACPHWAGEGVSSLCLGHGRGISFPSCRLLAASGLWTSPTGFLEAGGQDLGFLPTGSLGPGL